MVKSQSFQFASLFCSIICWTETSSSESVYDPKVNDLMRRSSSVSDKCSVDIAIVKNPYATEEWRKDNEGCQACLTIFIDQTRYHHKNSNITWAKGMIPTIVCCLSSSRLCRYFRCLALSNVLHNLQDKWLDTCSYAYDKTVNDIKPVNIHIRFGFPFLPATF